MASSHSFYSNDEAYQTTLNILMETTADVHFIFNVTINNSADIEVDTCVNGMDASEMGDDGTKLYNQDAIDLKAILNDAEIGARETGDGKMDTGESSNGKMDDDGTKMDSQETIGSSQIIDSEMNEVEAANAEKGADEPGASEAGGGLEEMSSQNLSLQTTALGAVPQYEIVKIPAHKQVLAKLSPVFNAEFNGPLKEEGDVPMVGTSPTTFNKFLQFFYEQKINLTMDSVEDVMILIDRYDVKTAWPICVKYLQKKLSVDDILWALSMAVKFQLDDLKLFCTDKIRNNCAKVCSMIELDVHGRPKLRSNPNNRPLCDADLADIFPHVFSSINLHLSNPSMLTEREIDANIIPLTLITGNLNREKPLGETHYFTIASNTRLWLTHIEFSELNDDSLDSVECNVKMWIQEKDQQNDSEPITLFTHTFKVSYDEDDNRVQITPNPIEIKPNHFTYRVYAQMSPYDPPVYAKETIRTNRSIEVAPNTFITFINSFERGVLAKAIFFRAQQPT